MCRVLSYLGQPLRLEDVLYKPDVSFVNQTHQAALFHRLNLAGSGLLAWHDESEFPDLPFTYRSTQLAIYDRNLQSLSKKVRATCLLAHLRGVAYNTKAIIGEQNLHPFLFDEARLALAHNGQLARFEEMRYRLLDYMKPEIVRQVRGSTDSEWFYALLLSQLDQPYADLPAQDIAKGVHQALRIVAKVRKEMGIRTFSPMNLFLCDGNDLVAACFTFDPDCFEGLGDNYHPPDEQALRIWYTTGDAFGYYDNEWKMKSAWHSANAVIVASEPLTRDHDTWAMVPAQHMIYVRRTEKSRRVELVPLDVE